MQARECQFRLASGCKCRAAANRHQPFCRHHAPAPAVPAPPAIPKCELYSDLRRWRRLGSQLASMPAREIPREIWDILQCLIDRGPNFAGHISNLTAGRYLRTLLNRLGDVPFADPDLALFSAEQDASLPYPIPVPAAARTSGSSAPQTPGSTAKELSALFAALGVPQLLADLPQPAPSRSPMNQSRARVNQ